MGNNLDYQSGPDLDLPQNSTGDKTAELSVGVRCDRPGFEVQFRVKTGKAQCEHMCSALPPKDGVIGRPSLWIAEDFWVLRFRLMVKRGPSL